MRRVFYSFDHHADSFRASQVRNIRAVEGSKELADNDWEKVAARGDKSIQRWIDGQMYGRSCVVVLIGSSTAGRRWIRYEIRKGWLDRKGILGIYIHNLRNSEGKQSRKGPNPFDYFKLGRGRMSSVIKAYDPQSRASKRAYEDIRENIEMWVEEAIAIRYRCQLTLR